MNPEPAPYDKASRVRRLFARIVPRYDLMNTLMTQGRDQRWRRRAAAACALPPGGVALDVATGTGKQALALLRQGAGRVMGVDFCQEMLESAHRRSASGGAPGVGFALADALCLPFRDNTFDAAVSSFLIRNVTDIEAAFAEQARVVKPGGRVVCLEIAMPPPGLFGSLFRFFFFRLVPVLGGLVTGEGDAYRYLPHSLEEFPSPAGLAALMERAGLGDVRYRLWAGRSVSLHVGEKS